MGQPGVLANTFITVRGSYEAPDGTPAAGWVALSLLEERQVHAEDPSFVTSKRVAVELTGGAFSASVVASDDPQWADGPRLYRVEEHLAQHPHREWFCYLNGPGPVDLPSVAPIDPVDCGVTVPTTSHAALTDLDVGDPHPQYADADHYHDPGDSHDHDGDYEPAGAVETHNIALTPHTGLFAAAEHSHAPTESNWKWSDSLSGDPGPGYIAADAALWEAATELRINDLDGDGNDVPDLPEAINAGDTVMLSNQDTADVGIYEVITVSDQGSWDLLTVRYDRGGGGNPLPDANMKISFTPQSAAPHAHDDRYYSEAETDGLLAGKSDTSHDHAADYAPAEHDTAHDDRFSQLGHDHAGAYDPAGTAQGLVDTHEATVGKDFHAYGWVGTQAEYDALGSYEATRIYYVVG